MLTKTTSRQIKLHKKMNHGTGRSKRPKNYGETLESKKKGFQGNKNARISIDDAVDAPYNDIKMYKKENSGRRNVRSNSKDRSFYEQKVDGARGDAPYNDNKMYKKENSGRRNVRSNTKDRSFYEQKVDGARGPINNDRKRKRVYADCDISKEGMFHKNVETPTRKFLSKGRNELKHNDANEKRTMRGKSRDFVQLQTEKVFKGERKPRETRSLDYNDHTKLRPMPKAVDKMDRDGNSSMNRNVKSKSNSRGQLEQNQNRIAAESLAKSAKKKVQDKKSVGDDLEENDDRPKKRKRVIRIDPHDISNKRLDDGIVTIGHTKEKKEDTETNGSVEMSKNAQFRAIKPSPSVLSFVEDNFLGRRRLIELRRAGYNTELSAPLDNIPFSTSLERERIEDSIFRNKLTFFAAAKVSSSFPVPDLPEIAFAGRSNVGKSSLLNSLTRQWGVVRTSDKPGLTQTINFFKVGPKLSLVDLPGYGFAYAKEEVKEAWEELVKEYVSTRVGLKQVCLLIDTKWGMKPRDHELIDLMERSQTKYQIVLTKTDLVFPIDVARRAMQIEESLKTKKSIIQPVMMVSSKSGAGIRSLRTVLAKIARFAKL